MCADDTCIAGSTSVDNLHTANIVIPYILSKYTVLSNIDLIGSVNQSAIQ